MADTTALAVLADIQPALFFAENGSRSFLESLKLTVREQAAKLDISTKQGREEIAALSYKVSRTKTGIDDLGKELVEGWKKAAKVVDAERKLVRDECDALRDEVRKPLTEWEEADAKRVAALEFKVVTVQGFAQLPFDANTAQIEDRIAQLDALDTTNMQEFTSRAELAVKTTRDFLTSALATAQRRDAEAAEAKRLREEAAAEAKRKEEQRIAQEARDKALREAEVERQRVEQEKFAAEARAKQAEAERIAAQERAEREAKAAAERHAAALEAARVKAEADAKEAVRLREEAQARHEAQVKAAAEKAEQDRLAAVEAEKARAAELARKEKAEAEAREQNRKHAAKINGEVRDALIKATHDPQLALSVDQATAIVAALAKGLIPHTRIAY